MKEYDANSTMQGHVFIKSRKRKFAYVFEEGCLTVFSGNSIPISENEEIELNLHSNTDYVIANDEFLRINRFKWSVIDRCSSVTAL